MLYHLCIEDLFMKRFILTFLQFSYRAFKRIRYSYVLILNKFGNKLQQFVHHFGENFCFLPKVYFAIQLNEFIFVAVDFDNSFLHIF